MKISLVHLLVAMIEAPLKDFLRVIMSWNMVNPSCLLFLETYSFRQIIMHKVLSSYTLYPNLPGGFPFLEYLSTSVDKKGTDRSFITILLILNCLIALNLSAASSNSRTVSFCVNVISDNK